MTEPFADQSADVDADHLVETPESLRDDDPESMPIDRGRDLADRPLGAEKFGTTHAEEAEGASLDLRLNEEEPDIGAHDPVDDIVADHPQTFASSDVDAEQTDEIVLADTYAGAGAADEEPAEGQTGLVSDTPDEERPDILEAMAVYSADGQADDESGNDAAAGARDAAGSGGSVPGRATAGGPDDRESHGPA